MAGIKLEDDVPQLPDDEVKRYRDFSRIRTRYGEVSHGFRKRRFHKFRNRYWFLAVLILLLVLIMLFT